MNVMEMTECTPRRSAARSCRHFAPVFILFSLTWLSACASNHVPAPQVSAAIPPAPIAPAPAPPVPEMVNAGPQMVGIASWYRPGPGLHRTCTGETFTRNEMTAASHSIPMGTQVRVALLNQNRSIVVRVNDCMPHGHRILDLSESAAEQLGLVDMGIARVTVTPVLLVDNR